MKRIKYLVLLVLCAFTFIVSGCGKMPAKCEHTSSNWIIDKQATCTEKGSIHKECTVCHEKIITEEIEALGHDYKEWIIDIEAICNKTGQRHSECSRCGKVIKEEYETDIHYYELYKAYDASDNSKAHIDYRCINCKIEKTQMFEQDETWTIEDNTIRILDYAFNNCKNLVNIEIPNSVTSIGANAFKGCSSLTSITLPFVGNGSDKAHFGYIFGAEVSFENSAYVPTSLKKVIITGGTSIGWYAFLGCTSLTSIEIPNSVTSIGDSAFKNCNNLTSITLPFIGNGSDQTHFGYIFGAKKYVPTSLKEVIITGGTSIGDDAFSYCTSLTSIGIPSSIVKIGQDAFYNCSNLTNVYYKGTIEDWCKISFSRWNFTSNPMFYASHIYMLDENNEYKEVTEIVIPETITKIGDYQFYGFENVTSIIISNSVTSIGNYAFSDCSNLTNVYYKGKIEDWCKISFNLWNSNPMYYASHIYMLDENNEYEEVTEIVIPETITKIGDYQFYGFKSITSIEIPNSVTSIGNGAFSGCSNLIYNEYENGKYLGNSENLYFILVGVSSIDAESITIHTNTRIIGSSAFYGCSSLENVYYKGTIEDWCKISFNNYDSNPMSYASHIYMLNENNEYKEVTEIIIPETITKICDYQFYNFKNVTSIEIPNSVTNIGEIAFRGCSSLTSIKVDSGNKVYDSREDCNAIIETATNTLVIGFMNTIIPSTVTSIGSGAFSGCTSLTSIEIPNSVTSIGEYAFFGCTSLTNIEIPNSVTYIGSSAFSGCSNLTIYCEAASQPEGWASNWNHSNRPVLWGYKK